MNDKNNGLFRFRASIPKKVYLGIASLSIFSLFLGWTAIYFLQVFPESFFPGPHKVLTAGSSLFFSYGFSVDVLASSARIGVAFVVSAIIAIPLGLLMSSFKAVEAFFEPAVDFIRYVPVPALIPVFVLWTGIDETSKFLVLFFGTFFQLLLLIMDDADNVPNVYFDIARTMGASNKQLFRHVLIPYLMPHIYDRLRVTLGWCWTYLVIAELVAVKRGVGHVLKEAQRFNAADQMFVCLIVLGIIGLLTDYLAKMGYKKLFPYAIKSKSLS